MTQKVKGVNTNPRMAGAPCITKLYDRQDTTRSYNTNLDHKNKEKANNVQEALNCTLFCPFIIVSNNAKPNLIAFKEKKIKKKLTRSKNMQM